MIKENNLLDASNFHRVELYCKEIELEISLGQVNKKKNFFNLPNAIIDFILFIGYIIIFPLNIFFEMFSFVFVKEFPKPLNFNEFIIYWKNFISEFNSMFNFRIWIDYLLLKIYRNTSDHHTNFVKILNFSIGMIALYAVLNFVFNISIGVLLSYISVVNVESFYIFIILPLLFAFFIIKERKIFHLYALVIIFSVLGYLTIGFIMDLSGRFVALFLMSYFLALIIFYTLFICETKIIIFILRFFSYIIFLMVIILKPQLINPFVGVFASDKLFESKLEQKLNESNSSTIIKLAKISQKDFSLQKDYNISFTELNSTKILIMANKDNIKDENLKKEIKKCLGNYDEIIKVINQDKILSGAAKSTGVVYSIILLLCIFSLQKTARRNSIVPS